MGGKLMGHDADQAGAEREIAQKSAVSYEPHTQRHTYALTRNAVDLWLKYITSIHSLRISHIYDSRTSTHT